MKICEMHYRGELQTDAQKKFTQVDWGTSDPVKRAQTRSEDPHRCEQNFTISLSRKFKPPAWVHNKLRLYSITIFPLNLPNGLLRMGRGGTNTQHEL